MLFPQSLLDVNLFFDFNENHWVRLGFREPATMGDVTVHHIPTIPWSWV